MARAKDTNARVTRWFLVLQDFHFAVRHRAGTANANADGLSRIWAAFAGLSGFSPPPAPVSPSSHRPRTTLGGGECDACPERSLPSPWKPTRITCTSSSRAGRAHLRLVTAGLDKPPQHTHCWDMSPEDSMLTLNSALYSREQRLTGQPRTRARHGGQPLESTSTARRTATGEHEHRSPTHDREKPTSPNPSINSPSGAFIWLPLVVWFFTPLQYIYIYIWIIQLLKHCF